MNRCSRCKIEIKDDVVACPLCHGVIAKEADTVMPAFYPDVQPKMRKLLLFLKIMIFVSILAEGIMLVVNFAVNPEIKWSFITGIALFYGCFSLSVSVLHNRSLRRKILVQLMFSIVFMLLLDLIIGFQGWSLAFGAPIAILAVQLMIIVLMIVYHNRWQSYLFLQVAIVLFGLLFFVLALCNVFKFKVLVYVAFAVPALLLFAFILFGGRRAGDELKQRFKV